MRRLLDGRGPGVSLILWGPPGTGKTTLARLAAGAADAEFVSLSAVTDTVKDVRDVVTAAKTRLEADGRRTLLFLDEVHRFSKTQQDSLLPSVEAGIVTLIAATTENPHFAIIDPLLSRSVVLVLEPLSEEDLGILIERARIHPDGLDGAYEITDAAVDQLIRMSSGDARRVLNLLELSVTSPPNDRPASAGPQLIDVADVERAAQRPSIRYDRDGDQHYDVISAFIKSVRGSDVDAALHYLARMIEAGEDPRFIARRLIISASEDIGMAEPTALTTAVNAFHAVNLIGMPEGRLALAQATVHLCLAPKSNAVYSAINDALADVRRGRTGPVPIHLRDAHYRGAGDLGHGVGYQYPHDHPEALVAQQYAPDTLTGRAYYHPTSRGVEGRLSELLARARDRLKGKN